MRWLAVVCTSAELQTKGTSMNGYGAQIAVITYGKAGRNEPFAAYHIAEAKAAGHTLVWCSGYVRIHRSK